MIKVPGLAVLPLVVLTTGCATIDYVGQSYQPTEQVDIYLSEADVPKEYQVIGQVRAAGDQYTSASRLQNKMMAQAREKGADAVIILDVAKVRFSEQKQVDETTTVSKDDSGKTVHKTTTVSSPSAEGNVIRALFIKYR